MSPRKRPDSSNRSARVIAAEILNFPLCKPPTTKDFGQSVTFGDNLAANIDGMDAVEEMTEQGAITTNTQHGTGYDSAGASADKFVHSVSHYKAMLQALKRLSTGQSLNYTHRDALNAFPELISTLAALAEDRANEEKVLLLTKIDTREGVPVSIMRKLRAAENPDDPELHRALIEEYNSAVTSVIISYQNEAANLRNEISYLFAELSAAISHEQRGTAQSASRGNRG